MGTYLLAYHGGGMPQSDADRARVMEQWGQWFGELGSDLVDGGNPIGQTRTIQAGGSVTEGGGANPVSGYSVIKASDLQAAIASAKDCPLLKTGGTIEVCETFSAM
jgi:hypothetical protein